MNQGISPTIFIIGGVAFLLWLAIMILTVVVGWIVFEKAGQPGWAMLIPFFNVYIGVKVATLPVWWFILLFVPVVNVVPGFIIPLAIARNFGKEPLFGIGMIFLPFIFWPILAFGQAEYDPRPMFDDGF